MLNTLFIQLTARHWKRNVTITTLQKQLNWYKNMNKKEKQNRTRWMSMSWGILTFQILNATWRERSYMLKKYLHMKQIFTDFFFSSVFPFRKHQSLWEFEQLTVKVLRAAAWMHPKAFPPSSDFLLCSDEGTRVYFPHHHQKWTFAVQAVLLKSFSPISQTSTLVVTLQVRNQLCWISTSVMRSFSRSPIFMQLYEKQLWNSRPFIEKDKTACFLLFINKPTDLWGTAGHWSFEQRLLQQEEMVDYFKLHINTHLVL